MERGREKKEVVALLNFISVSYKRFAFLLRELTVMSRRRDNLITSPSRCCPAVSVTLHDMKGIIGALFALTFRVLFVSAAALKN